MGTHWVEKPPMSPPVPAAERQLEQELRAKALSKIMGNAILGEGFFFLPFVQTEGEEVRIPLAADAEVISAVPGLLSVPILEAELPHLFEGEWDWQVTAVGENLFSIVFPNKALLRMATRSGKLFLSLNNILAEIKESLLEEPKAEIMPDVWVKLWGVPPKHRREDRLLAGTVMIGRPMEVDKASLVGLGPVRMRFACRSPAKLRGYVQLWFNSEGFTIRMEAEADGLQGAAPPPPPPASVDKGPDGKDQERDTSMGDDSIDTATWDKLGIKGKEPENGPPAGEAAKDQEERQGVVGSNETRFDQYGSNLSLGLDIDKGVSASCVSEGRSLLVSPTAAGVGGARMVVRSPPPTLDQGGSGIRSHKKTAGRKATPVAPVSPPLVCAGTPASLRPVVMALASPRGSAGGLQGGGGGPGVAGAGQLAPKRRQGQSSCDATRSTPGGSKEHGNRSNGPRCEGNRTLIYIFWL
ncbi:unnamed protein product [Triticum aestivum]|uniref:Uncharacterized protein n=1 Tax=Triticum aestivum TaxID=4565 RepID=A0A7H4LG85_WHEAT|nr:unnamed protein product [Triticum aestivum]